MTKFILCLVALSFFVVYVDCASLKSTVPYELSMQRFRDIIKTYKSRFPDSFIVQDLLEVFSQSKYDDISFFPSIGSFILFAPTVSFNAILVKAYEILTRLKIDIATLGLDKLSHLSSQINVSSEESQLLGKPVLDLIEFVDWSLLFTYNFDLLSIYQENVVSLSLKYCLITAIDDLSQMSTLDELVAYDLVKQVQVFLAIIEVYGVIAVGK